MAALDVPRARAGPARRGVGPGVAGPGRRRRGDARPGSGPTEPGRTWLLLQGARDGPVVGEIGAADRVRRLSVRAGRYFVLGRGPDVLLEGPVDAAAGGSAAVDERRLSRTAYARLLRKGEGEARAAASVELASRVRGALLNDRGACPGVAAGIPLALRSLTVTPRVAWCRSGFSRPGLSATVDEADVEISAAHVWDLRAVSAEGGLTVGGAAFHQTFRTAGVAPARTTAALQLSPTVGVSRDLGACGYLFASAAGATYLFRSRSTATGREAFGPSFAPSVAVGLGLRL